MNSSTSEEIVQLDCPFCGRWLATLVGENLELAGRVKVRALYALSEQKITDSTLLPSKPLAWTAICRRPWCRVRRWWAKRMGDD